MDILPLPRIEMVILALLLSACAPRDPDKVGQLEQASWVELGSSLASPVITGNTCGAASQVTPTCVPALCPDQSFRWTAPYSGSFVFLTVGSSPNDTVLQVMAFTTNHTGMVLGCNDDAAGAPTSSLTISLSAGQLVEVVVDEYGNGSSCNCGNCQLNISAASPPACNTPPNGCYGASGTFSNGACAYPPQTAGTACNDNNSCTTGDVCNGAGVCSGTPRVCDTPPGQCYESSGSCSSGTCQYPCKPAGTVCDDGNLCTEDDACDGAGHCLGSLIPPDDANCDPNSNCVVPGPWVTCNNGTQQAAMATVDCRWCISRDACGWDPPICPF
jgi:hypothetical protein